MIKEAVGFGNTVEEAKEDAMLSFGASAEDDLQIEILEMPKKKVLGMFGGARAKVRVYMEVPDEKEPPVKKKQKKTVNKKNTEKSREVKTDNSVSAESIPAENIPADSSAGRAVAYLKSILPAFGYQNAVISVSLKENAALISLDGEDMGALIGRRGETLEALRVLTALAANKGGGYYKININVGNYREKREQALTSLANRIAKQVLSSGRNRTLEPMSPYERRIIHTAVQSIEGVESNSVGEGENRRVVIHVKGRSFDTDRSARRPHVKGHDRSRTNVVLSKPDREPMKDSDVPLYGKIEN